MSDYIKREDAINELCNNCTVGTIEYGECRYMFNGECKEARGIKDLPSADVVERKRGEWAKRTHDTLIAQVNFAYCSECGQPIMHEHTRPLWNFCPNCGAKMKGNSDE